MDARTKTDGTVGKALEILDIVERFQRPVKFNDILAQSPFPKPSTYRLLQTLVSQEMLSFNSETAHYGLGNRLIRLAHSAWQSASLAPIAAPYIDKLSRETGETIHLAKLDNGQVLYLDKRNAIKPLTMFSDAGKISPAYCTGVGKAMLAYLDDAKREHVIAQQSFYQHTENTLTSKEALLEVLEKIREDGIAFDREEHEPNIICIAVPILNKNGEILGGMSITDSTSRTSFKELQKYKGQLQQTARQIAENAKIWMLPTNGG